MCGITGWIDWERDLRDQGRLIDHMSDTLAHRGPDARGHWLSAHAALAHRRLIVIDPDSGEQPMVFGAEEQCSVLTYNGEIYNYRELRHELEQRGHVFTTQSDTEVLLHSYIEWQEACVLHLNGIFAFGLWDEQQQRLFIARDHLGVKPLFYAQRGSAFFFASEIKALLAHPEIKAEVDQEGLTELLSVGFTTRTPGVAIFRGIYDLRPGYSLTCTRQGVQMKQYWRLQSKPHMDDLETTTEYVRALLQDTVKRQLISDMPLASLLSGGLDSSALTVIAARNFAQEYKTLSTYSVDFVASTQYFEGNSLRPNMDAPWVKRVSEYMGTNHQTVTLDTPELIENMLVPLHAYDLPATGEIDTSLYLLFREMKKDVTVSLSGESADEVFGGYPWFHEPQRINASTFPWLAQEWGTSPLLSVKAQSTQTLQEYVWFSLQWGVSTLLSAEAQATLHSREHVARRYQEALDEVPRLAGEEPHAARLREIFYLNLTRFLNGLLTRKDRMSMAVGFEVRVPYCDYRLVDYVWNIPWEMKTVGNIEKGILRRACADILPDDVCMRRKSAYPSTRNPSYLQAVQTWVLDILNDPNAPIRSFINIQKVRQVAEGKRPELPGEAAIHLFDSLIQLNCWFKDYHVSVTA